MICTDLSGFTYGLTEKHLKMSQEYEAMPTAPHTTWSTWDGNMNIRVEGDKFYTDLWMPPNRSLDIDKTGKTIAWLANLNNFDCARGSAWGSNGIYGAIYGTKPRCSVHPGGGNYGDCGIWGNAKLMSRMATALLKEKQESTQIAVSHSQSAQNNASRNASRHQELAAANQRHAAAQQQLRSQLELAIDEKQVSANELEQSHKALADATTELDSLKQALALEDALINPKQSALKDLCERIKVFHVEVETLQNQLAQQEAVRLREKEQHQQNILNFGQLKALLENQKN